VMFIPPLLTPAIKPPTAQRELRYLPTEGHVATSIER
jgi:hypothetical protein